MTTKGKELSDLALALPEEDRAQIADLLLQSLDLPGESCPPGEWAETWKAELESRIDEIRSGKVQAVPADQVMRELRAKQRV